MNTYRKKVVHTRVLEYSDRNKFGNFWIGKFWTFGNFQSIPISNQFISEFSDKKISELDYIRIEKSMEIFGSKNFQSKWQP